MDMISNLDCLALALALRDAGELESVKWLKENPPPPLFPLDFGSYAHRVKMDYEDRRRLAAYKEMFEIFGL